MDSTFKITQDSPAKGGVGSGLAVNNGGATHTLNNPNNLNLNNNNNNNNNNNSEMLSKNDSPLVYLVETFYISSKKNTVFQVRLTDRGIILRKESNGSTKEQTILLEDIIGSRCLRSKKKRAKGGACACTSLTGPAQLKVVEENSGEQDETDVSAYLYIYAYVLKRSRSKNDGNRGRRERTSITLRFRSFDKYEDNNREAQKWRAAIKYLLNGESPRSPVYQSPENRKVLVLLNPKSGSGKAREIFQQRVAPIFLEAEIPYDLHVTKRANFAREYVRIKDIYAFRYIVVVGGDGIFFEVINGIFERSDWQKAVEEIGIGIIPCGSGNGLAKSIAFEYNVPYDPKPVLSATLSCIRGRSAQMDVVRVETRSQIMFSFLSVGWGFISDIDIESERLRAIGGQRFTIWSVHRLISLRTYNGKVSYRPATPAQIAAYNLNGKEGDAPKHNISKLKHSMSYNTTLDCPKCHGDGDCENCDTEFDDVLSLETSTGAEHYRPRLDSWYSATSRKSAYFSTADSIYKSINEKLSINESNITGEPRKAQMFGPGSNIPALITPVPDSWTTLTGDFVMVHAAYQTHLAGDCYFAPSSKLNDGLIWLLIIKAGISRSQLLSFLLSLNTGTHIPDKHEHISMIPVTAFRIEPKSQNGIMTVDGEHVEHGPIQGEIFPGMLNVIVPQSNDGGVNS